MCLYLEVNNVSISRGDCVRTLRYVSISILRPISILTVLALHPMQMAYFDTAVLGPIVLGRCQNREGGGSRT